MTNKMRVEKAVKELGYSIGCWNEKLEDLSSAQLKKVIEGIEFQEDTDVSIKRKKHVVEIDIVDGEVDFGVLTKAEYIDRYGDERYQ